MDPDGKLADLWRIRVVNVAGSEFVDCSDRECVMMNDEVSLHSTAATGRRRGGHRGAAVRDTARIGRRRGARHGCKRTATLRAAV